MQRIENFAALDIPLEYVRSKRSRRLRITMQPMAPIRVTVPKRMSLRTAEEFVEQRTDWIRKQAQKFQSHQNQRTVFRPGMEFWTRGREVVFEEMKNEELRMKNVGLLKDEVNEAPLIKGEALNIFAKLEAGGLKDRNRKILNQVQDDVDIKISLTPTQILIHYHPETDFNSSEVQDQIRSAVIEVWREEAKAYIVPRVDELAAEFGFDYNRVTIKNIVSRWGSCSTKKNLNFSLHLMRLEDRFIDYVILHELCHTVHMNHGAGFWRLLSEVCPGAREIDREMRPFSLRYW